MLPGMGGFEAVVIALLALVIVGPKDLPILMRKLARWVNKVRGMAAEFRMSFDELARQSELDELRREVEALRRGDPLHPVRAELDPIAQEINSGLSNQSLSNQSLSDHSSLNDRDHAAYEAAVAQANGEAPAAADPYTPSFEPTPPPAPSPTPIDAAPPAAAEPESVSPATAESPAPPAAKRARRKAGAASVAGGEA